VNSATVAAPDGKPIAWCLNFLYGIKQNRIAGMDLLPDLMKKSEIERLPIFIYGSTEEMLNTTREYLLENHPHLLVAGFLSPPFKQLSQEEEEEHARIINKSGAKIVFVVLGCPKQEYWMSRMTNRINAVLIGVGGALPVLVGQQKRAPAWMQDAGLEWLFRLSQEPKRLWKRYLVTNSIFIAKMIREKLSSRFRWLLGKKNK
jgi:N-acetylglucosaminyldiphosphoundecaprenol N-acetyl-beta-D-mannosaminyltransferase